MVEWFWNSQDRTLANIGHDIIHDALCDMHIYKSLMIVCTMLGNEYPRSIFESGVPTN